MYGDLKGANQLCHYQTCRGIKSINNNSHSQYWDLTSLFFFSFKHNTDSTFAGYDHNVLPVWGQGVTGKNVVVSILDDGMIYFTV